MPAITVDDLTVLERLKGPGLGDQPRPVWQVTTAPAGLRGGGLPRTPRVRRHRPRAARPVRDDGPDGRGRLRAGRAEGHARGTRTAASRPSPTSSTASSTTRTRHGGGGTITNGDTQWMTAGSGLLHIEAPPEWLVEKGGLFHGIQLWVNLPRDAKMNDPRYQDIRSGQVALLTTPDAGALVRVIAGSVDGHDGPGSTFTPMSLVHATIEPGARLDLPWDVDYNALVYVLNGTRHRRAWTGRPIQMGQSAVLGAGDYLTVTADGTQEGRSPKLDVIVVGGRPIKRADRLGRAVRDEHQGRGDGGLHGLPEGPVRAHR